MQVSQKRYFYLAFLTLFASAFHSSSLSNLDYLCIKKEEKNPIHTFYVRTCARFILSFFVTGAIFE